MQKYVIWTSLVVFLIMVFVIQVPNCINSEKTNSWLHRAKDAGNPIQVSEFLTNYKEMLYQDGKVDGKYASVFHYPGTYMPTYIRAIDGLIQRANDLATQNSTDTSYQMGLVNLEKDLGDIEATAYSVWVADIGWLVFVVAGVAIILLFVFWTWLMY